MFPRVVTQFVSDLSGEELGADGQTVSSGWEGTVYELDLSTAEAGKIEKILALREGWTQHVTRNGQASRRAWR